MTPRRRAVAALAGAALLGGCGTVFYTPDGADSSLMLYGYDPVAYFTFHQGKWFLVNQSNADMLLVDQPDYLRHGHATEITPGLRLLLSLEEGGRLAVFDLLSP